MAIEVSEYPTEFEEQFKSKILADFGDILLSTEQLSYAWFQKYDLLRGLVLYFHGDIHALLGLMNTEDSAPEIEEISINKIVNTELDLNTDESQIGDLPRISVIHNGNNGHSKEISNDDSVKINPIFRTSSTEVSHRHPRRKPQLEESALHSGNKVEKKLNSKSIYVNPLPTEIKLEIFNLMEHGFAPEEQQDIYNRIEKLFSSEDDFVHYPNVEEMFYSALFSKYELKIYSYIYRRSSDQVLSEDLTQQVFLKMLESINNQKSWHSSFSGWLYRIAHNLVIDHYRARDRQKNVSIDEIPHIINPHDNPVKAAEVAFGVDTLKKSLRRLTDEQAQVISLRYLEGYSFYEIAQLLDKTEGAVKALQHRAIATLRVLLADEY